MAAFSPCGRFVATGASDNSVTADENYLFIFCVLNIGVARMALSSGVAPPEGENSNKRRGLNPLPL